MGEWSIPYTRVSATTSVFTRCPVVLVTQREFRVAGLLVRGIGGKKQHIRMAMRAGFCLFVTPNHNG